MTGLPRRTATVLAAAALVLLLAGCWQGFNAQTTLAPPSGDGVSGAVGNIEVRSATWVRSAVNPANMTLVASFINTQTTPDVLTKVTTAPTATVEVTGGAISLNPTSRISTGQLGSTGQPGQLYINAFGINTPESSFVSTTLSFQNAGNLTLSILTVPSTGIYAGIEPGSPAPIPKTR